jgi:hypothetical protein
MCLKIWLENYKKQKDINMYLAFAGVNYDSYNEKWEKFARWVKQLNCYKNILKLFWENKIDNKNYNFLLQFKPHLEKLKTIDEKIRFLHQYTGHWYKVLFKIK